MSNVATTTRELGSYLEAFTELAKRAPGQNQGWLRKLREDAFARFCEAGFPTTHDEDWRFTNVAAIAQTAFRLPPAETKVRAEQIEPYRLRGAACQLVFVNGRF
ncbi:MAG: Fe-S cluster assembly protein SufD, partial [Acidobacteriota bacterium]